MVTEAYLTTEQTKRTFFTRPDCELREIGLQWVYERGQYMIVDEKKWLMAKLKYGL